MNYKCLVFYLCRGWKVAVCKVVSGACNMILLKAQARSLQVANSLGVETKVPYDLVAVTGYDRASSVGSGDLHQERYVPLAITFQ